MPRDTPVFVITFKYTRVFCSIPARVHMILANQWIIKVNARCSIYHPSLVHRVSCKNIWKLREELMIIFFLSICYVKKKKNSICLFMRFLINGILIIHVDFLTAY